MPRIAGTTHAQTIFLRAFRSNPAGPPPDLWPAPSILRKWLRKPAFKRALHSVQESLRFQADFHLASAASLSIRKVLADQTPINPQDSSRLLRLCHVRQRFGPSAPLPALPPAEKEPDAQLEPEPESEFDEDGSRLNHDERELRKIKDEALRFDFLPPINHYPDFPEPVPQDTYYYKLLHHPHTLLWYMKLYTERFKDDPRFKKILDRCTEITPHEWPAGPFPHFPKTQNQLPT